MSTLLSLNSTSTAPIQAHSLDFSDDVASPQNRFAKHSLKNSNAICVFDSVSTTSMIHSEDVQSKLYAMTNEINRLIDVNLKLTKEVETSKARCKEAEKLIGKSTTITLDKRYEDHSDQEVNELEHLVAQLTRSLKQAQYIISLKDEEISNLKQKRADSYEEDIENSRHGLRDITLKVLKENIDRKVLEESGLKNNRISIKPQKKSVSVDTDYAWEEKCGLLDFEIERLNASLKQKEEEISRFRENSKNFEKVLAEKNDLLQTANDTLETYKNEIELLCMEILRLRQMDISELKNTFSSVDNLRENTEEGYLNTLGSETQTAQETKFTFSGRQIDLGLARSLPASTGDEALSIRESLVDEQVSELHNKVNDIKSTARFTGIPEEKKSEVEVLKEEVVKLKRAIAEYEEVVTLWSKELQSAEVERRIKQAIEKKLAEYKWKLGESEKKLVDAKLIIHQREEEIRSSEAHNSELVKVIGRLKEKLGISCQDEPLSPRTQRQWTTSLLEEISEEHSFREVWAEEKQTLLSEIRKYELKVKALEEDQKKLAEVMKENLQYQKEKRNMLENEVNEYDLEMLRQKEHMEKEAELERGFYIQEIEKLESMIKDLRSQVEQGETRILELTEENLRLNILAVENIREIEELRSSYTEEKEAYGDEMKNKFLKSYIELEEIATVLEVKKNSMQTQLDQMKNIIETNFAQIKELRKTNKAAHKENKMLSQEIERLKGSEEFHHSRKVESKEESA